MSKRAAILIIGNEILSGKTEDINSAYLCKELRKLGVLVSEIAVIPDEVVKIAKTVKLLSQEFDYVFTSGGVGPTHDDVTMQGIAEAFGVKTVRHSALIEILKGWYKNGLNEARLKMTEIPEGSEFQGFDKLSFPVIVFKNIFIFPGVPQILREKFEAVKEDFRSAPFYLKTVYTDIPEGLLAESLNHLLVRYPKLLVGSYPELNNPAYRVKVTLESKDNRYLEEAYGEFIGSLDPGSIVKVESEPVESR